MLTSDELLKRLIEVIEQNSRIIEQLDSTIQLILAQDEVEITPAIIEVMERGLPFYHKFLSNEGDDGIV